MDTPFTLPQGSSRQSLMCPQPRSSSLLLPPPGETEASPLQGQAPHRSPQCPWALRGEGEVVLASA